MAFSFFKKKSNACNSTLPIVLENTVNISMEVVESCLIEGQMSKESRELFANAQSSASAVEEISATAETISVNAGHVSSEMGEAEGESNSAAGAMDSIQQNMTRAEDSIKRLQKGSDEINDIVRLIDDVSEQTNLLALNAAIEAARAGEAGRGFAVVADEVKKLSERSQKATAEITRTIQEIRSDISDAVDAVTTSSKLVADGTGLVSSLNEKVTNSRNMVENIAQATTEQTQATQDISESMNDVLRLSEENQNIGSSLGNTFSSLMHIIEEQRALLATEDIPNKVLYLAKADHVLWKKKVLDHILGRTHLKPSDAGSHKGCRLGLWYQGDDAKQFRSHPAFSELDAPHARVHQLAGEIIDLHNNGAQHDLLDSKFAEMDAASAEVIKRLDILIATTK